MVDKLAQKHITELAQNQFTIVENLFPPAAIHRVCSWIDDERAQCFQFLRNALRVSTEQELVEVLQQCWRSGYARDTSSEEIKYFLAGFLRKEARISAFLTEIILQSEIRAIATTLLSCNYPRMHYPPAARYVLPNNPYGHIPPHQDISYNRHLTSFLVFWIPFTDIDHKCGGVTVYPSFKREQELIADNKKADFLYLRPIDVAASKGIELCMKAGSMLVLNPYIVHASTKNQSDKVRYSISMRCFSELVKSDKPYLDLTSGEVIRS